MNIKEVLCKFNCEITKFANRKQEFSNRPKKDFSRNRNKVLKL